MWGEGEGDGNFGEENQILINGAGKSIKNSLHHWLRLLNFFLEANIHPCHEIIPSTELDVMKTSSCASEENRYDQTPKKKKKKKLLYKVPYSPPWGGEVYQAC